MKHSYQTLIPLAALAVLTMPELQAQTVNTPPDAGFILQGLGTRSAQAPVRDDLDLLPELETREEAVAENGPTVPVKAVTFSGNTVISDAELTALLQPGLGGELTLSELFAMAETVSLYYRSHGYPFARAFLPPQELSDGNLKIEVLEGRFGKVTAASEDPKLARVGQGFLSPLQSGEVIESSTLERQTLLLNDLPGITTVPVIRPGDHVGTGDFDVAVRETRRWDASVGFDNHGNRYSGEYRSNVSASFYHLFTPGDRVSGILLYTNEDLILGRIGYDLPLGSSGLRGNISYVRTEYNLGYGFNGFTGLADVPSVGISYPVLRSQQSNVIFVARGQYKHFDDRLFDVTYQEKDSFSSTVGIEYDRRDNYLPFLGPGVTFGTLYVTAGSIGSDDFGVSTGGFAKLHGDISRLQSLPSNFSWFTNIDYQFAGGGILDSSESFLLGGADSVRAYPQGESASKSGVRVQNELRYSMKDISPYAFYDIGHVTEEGLNNGRTLSGAGLGIRYNRERFFIDASVAGRLSGGDSLSEPSSQRDIRAWISAGCRF